MCRETWRAYARRHWRRAGAAPTSWSSPSSRCRAIRLKSLLFHRGLRIQLEEALAQLAREVGDPASQLPALLVGYPEYEGEGSSPLIYNAARLLVPGRPSLNYRKICPPELQGVRREALLHARHDAHGGGVHGHEARPHHLRGLVGNTSPRAWPRRPVPSSCWPSMPRPTSRRSSARVKPCCASAWSKPACPSPT